MSSYGNVYLEKIDPDTCEWELYSLWDYPEKWDNNYKKKIVDYQGDPKRVPLWDGQGYIRDMLQKLPEENDYVHLYDKNGPALYKISDDLLEIIGLDKYEETNENNIYLTGLKVYWIYYSEFLRYLEKNLKVVDIYDEKYNPETEEYESVIIDNPLLALKETVNYIVGSKWDFYVDDMLRIVFWIDC